MQSAIPSGSSGVFCFFFALAAPTELEPWRLGAISIKPALLLSLSAESDDDCLHHAVHERLGELLRVLKIIISKHQSLNSVDILSTAGTVIATVKGEPQIFPCVNPPPRACRD